MKTKQLTHFEVAKNKSDKEIIVITENIRTPENIGMIFRISEAFGIKKVILIGDSPNLSNNRVIRTARNAEKVIDIHLAKEMKHVIQNLKENKFQLIGLERTNDSLMLKEFDFTKHQKIAIFLGAERFGIDETTLQQLDINLHIKLFGKNSSINVVNALAIILYEVLR